MAKLFKRLRPLDMVYIAVIVVFVVISVWLTLTIPDYMTEITTIVKAGGSSGDVLRAGLAMLACAVGDVICTVVVGFFTSRVSAGFSKRLRHDIYAKIMDFSMQEINGFSTGGLVTRTGNDVSQIQMFIALGLLAFLRAPVIAVWAFCKIIGKGNEWLLVTGIAIAIVVVHLIINRILVTPKFRIFQKLTDTINRLTSENLNGVRVVRAYNAEEYQRKKFDKTNVEALKAHLFTGKVMSFLHPGIQFVMNCTTLTIYIVGAFVINAAAVTERIGIFGNLVVFMAYVMQILISFMMISMVFMIFPRAEVSAARINELLDREVRIRDGNLKEVPGNRGTIEFRNATFKYPDAEAAVLENVSFTVEKGETAAFIGSTGSGKSTLINLIPRFYDVTEGAVLVNGVDVREYNLKDLHGKMGYVPQKAVLFKGTIGSNIDYGSNGRGGSREEIVHALEVAQGGDILKGEELGIDAPVAQGGVNFSGGQRQRISIARAIYKKPEFFIFDDSFSALDYKTDRKLRKELKKETEGVTTLIVAQRIGTVKDADKIVVLDEGRVVGLGTHRELLKSCEVYRQIAYSQLSKEELEDA
ncbi:MAG: ABC transporter ATP-binding protein [Lachnospiraceae bacterium]|jgi:ATP-binding cassette subfamily B multidrug efflux pump